MNKNVILKYIQNKYIRGKAIWSYCIHTEENGNELNTTCYILYRNEDYLQCYLSKDLEVVNVNMIYNGVLQYCNDIDLFYHIDIIEKEYSLKGCYFINNCNYRMETYQLGLLYFSNKEMENKLLEKFIQSYIHKNE